MSFLASRHIHKQISKKTVNKVNVDCLEHPGSFGNQTTKDCNVCEEGPPWMVCLNSCWLSEFAGLFLLEVKKWSTVREAQTRLWKGATENVPWGGSTWAGRGFPATVGGLNGIEKAQTQGRMCKGKGNEIFRARMGLCFLCWAMRITEGLGVKLTWKSHGHKQTKESRESQNPTTKCQIGSGGR